jgi:alpha-amylase/alpha-mannosidase (GH57 family)
MSVVLCWHMHQPEYRDLRTGAVHLPWTYLHAIKDYVDMAAHIEALPAARAVVNFAPILLEQIEDYVGQIREYLQGSGALCDPLLAALAEPALPGEEQARLVLVRNCLKASRQRMINRFEPYKRLAIMADRFLEHPLDLIYASNQFIADLLVWYHLAWMGESERRRDQRITRLQDKAANFTVHDRREILQIILEQMQGILPRYRTLAEQGKVELAMSPYAHPIVPLLLDMNSASEAMPEVSLPRQHYPGGEERVRWHLEQGLDTFARIFGQRPRGIWPSEGAISQPSLALVADAGFTWVASGGGVLNNSHDDNQRSCRHRVYRFGDAPIDCFFRDDGLSDLIGFQYSDWRAEDAVGDLVSHMENIADHCPDRRDCLITIILDGENAWEHFPDNGYHFLSQMYAAVAEHPRLELSTFERFLADKSPNVAHEPRVVAGSWVHGTFSTWIGDQDKNRGWSLLVEAKQAFDAQVAAGALSPGELRMAQEQLAICEGSDWFWWFGDYNPTATVGQFEQLFRMHLANLYQFLKLEAPSGLADVISRGGGTPSRGGVMRHSEPGGL